MTSLHVWHSALYMHVNCCACIEFRDEIPFKEGRI